MLRLMDAQSALLPISFLPDDDNHTSNWALMCLINVMGNQEAAKGEDSPIMVLRPDVVSIGNAALRCGNMLHLTIAFSSADEFRQLAGPRQASFELRHGFRSGARVPGAQRV